MLAGLPALISGMVGEALKARGIEVDVITDYRQLLRDLAPPRSTGAPSVVVVPTPDVCRALLHQDPQLRVLTLTAAARSADLYELRRLGSNVGERGVVAAVRAAFAPDLGATP